MQRRTTLSRAFKQIAREQARVAFEQNSRWHRGFIDLLDLDLLCLFSNHPWPSRREELRSLRRFLDLVGVPELAFATYPESGDKAGHSYAMLLGAAHYMHADVRWTINVAFAAACHAEGDPNSS